MRVGVTGKLVVKMNIPVAVRNATTQIYRCLFVTRHHEDESSPVLHAQTLACRSTVSPHVPPPRIATRDCHTVLQYYLVPF